MKLRSEDCLAVGICIKGQMRFCRQHGIDFRQFLSEGVSFEELYGIDDFNLTRAMAQALTRYQEVT